MSDLVLVVEDNEANQLLVSAVLELEGFQVRLAASAPDAMEQMRDRLPDVILMDIQLRGGSLVFSRGAYQRDGGARASGVVGVGTRKASSLPAPEGASRFCGGGIAEAMP